MAIGPVITGGFGSFGSVNLVVTDGFGIGAAVTPDTSGDLTLTRGRHAVSKLSRRQHIQRGLPINLGAIGNGLTVNSEGKLTGVAKTGGFIIIDEDGFSVDEAILIQALIADRSLKPVQDDIDDLTAMIWTGIL